MKANKFVVKLILFCVFKDLLFPLNQTEKLRPNPLLCAPPPTILSHVECKL